MNAPETGPALPGSQRAEKGDGRTDSSDLTSYDVNRVMGDRERRAACTCLPDSCDEEGEPGCRVCQLLDHAQPCPAEEDDGE